MNIQKLLPLILLICVPIWLKAQDSPEDFELKGMKSFIAALNKNEKVRLSNMTHYPIKVTIKKKIVTLKNNKDFITYYDRVFTKAFKSEIERDLSWENLLSDPKDGSWGIGVGQLWFTDYGKRGVLCSAINNVW
ncbi:hypothetical protein [Pedobacter boryungensis]|uniref:Uncharacterized protein n=1 Tax=Pedobacter boryungensis TaxID=869962 RepID=A0ABX2DHY4_9SPHI|nr:hypothetical protein [Pedobacter boryungensis]NQX33143.1 hypothetical protein [Pedobacter boryungensis]